uniref:Uncharacterized protein n=1 Tax=Molossus molossus TaxID=27622 RepID=A0A7J8E306_MOLMO|nr:hypothetical protein HJG59_009001 [Molossus molossus]
MDTCTPSCPAPPSPLQGSARRDPVARESGLALFPSPEKEEMVLEAPLSGQGTAEGHFLWGFPSGACCPSLLTSCWLPGPGEISWLSWGTFHTQSSTCPAVSRARVPTDLTAPRLLPHHSARVTGVIRHPELTRHHRPESLLLALRTAS